MGEETLSLNLTMKVDKLKIIRKRTFEINLECPHLLMMMMTKKILIFLAQQNSKIINLY
jgi:hypothetical protein